MRNRRNFYRFPRTAGAFRFIFDFFQQRIVIRFKSDQNRTVYLLSFPWENEGHLRALRIFIECPICGTFPAKCIDRMNTDDDKSIGVTFKCDLLRKLSGKRLRFTIADRVRYRLQCGSIGNGTGQFQCSFYRARFIGKRKRNDGRRIIHKDIYTGRSKGSVFGIGNGNPNIFISALFSSGQRNDMAGKRQFARNRRTG